MINTIKLHRATLSALMAILLAAACGKGEDPTVLVKSAREYLEKRDSKAAVIQLKNALQKAPNLAEGRFLLGKALLETGDAAGAEVELSKAFELKYEPDQTVPLLARAMVMKGEAKKLVDQFGTVELAGASANAELRSNISIAHSILGDKTAAKQALEAALAAQADNVTALLLQARVTASGGNAADALAIVDRVIAGDEKNAEAHKLRGDLLAAQNKVDGAIEAYDKTLQLKPDYLPAYGAAIALVMRQGRLEEADKKLAEFRKVAPKHPQTFFLSAMLSMQRKEFKAARDAMQEYHRMVSPSPLSQQLTGGIEYQLGAYGIAEENLAQALQSEPQLRLARRLLAATYLRMGQPQKALDTLKPMLGEIGDDPATLSIAGEVSLQLGDFRKAEEYFSKAAKLDPKDPAKRTRLALSHIATGARDTGFEELENISATDSGTIADLALVAVHLGKGDFEKALKAIDVIQKKRPEDPVVFQMRGQILVAKKDLSGARDSFSKAIALQPTFFPAAAGLASLDMAEKKPGEARKRYEAVLAADPKSLPAQLALAGLSAGEGAKVDEVAAQIGKAVAANPSSVEARLALIDTFLRGGEPKKAVAAAQEAMAAITDRVELVDAFGRAQLAAGDYNQALQAFSKSSTLQPKSPIPYLRMAETNVAANDKAEAIRNLKRSLELKPDYSEGQRALISLLIDGKQYQEALGLARKLQVQQPNASGGYIVEATIAAAQKSWPDAIKALRLGLEKAPSTELAANLYAALISSGNRPEAERFAAGWLKDRPKDFGFRTFLAESAASREDWSTAVQHYRAVAEVQPDSVAILNNLAYALGQIKDPKAVEVAERANKLAPNQPPVMDTLAMLLANKGDLERANELLSKAVELAPKQSAIRLNFARVLIKAGKKVEAKAQLDTLAKLGDAFPLQAEVARLQKEL